MLKSAETSSQAYLLNVSNNWRLVLWNFCLITYNWICQCKKARALPLSHTTFKIEQRDYVFFCVCKMYENVTECVCVCVRPFESKLVYGFSMPASKRLLCQCLVGSSNWPRIYSQLLVCRHNTQYYIISTFSVISSTVKTIMQLLSVFYIDETDDDGEVREREQSWTKE